MAKTEDLRKSPRSAKPVDAFDRKILGELARDATLSYAAVGQAVGLSAPAVHERVKRLRATGVITATSAQIDGASVGKPLLAFVHVDTVGWGMTRPMAEIADLPEVEEIHSATGDTCLILKVRVASPRALEGLLSRIYDIEGVRGTRTYLTLSTFVERGVQPEVSDALNEGGYAR